MSNTPYANSTIKHVAPKYYNAKNNTSQYQLIGDNIG